MGTRMTKKEQMSIYEQTLSSLQIFELICSLIHGINKEQRKSLISPLFGFVLKIALQFRSTMISTNLVLNTAAQMPASLNLYLGQPRRAPGSIFFHSSSFSFLMQQPILAIATERCAAYSCVYSAPYPLTDVYKGPCRPWPKEAIQMQRIQCDLICGVKFRSEHQVGFKPYLPLPLLLWIKVSPF